MEAVRLQMFGLGGSFRFVRDVFLQPGQGYFCLGAFLEVSTYSCCKTQIFLRLRQRCLRGILWLLLFERGRAKTSAQSLKGDLLKDIFISTNDADFVRSRLWHSR